MEQISQSKTSSSEGMPMAEMTHVSDCFVRIRRVESLAMTANLNYICNNNYPTKNYYYVKAL